MSNMPTQAPPPAGVQRGGGLATGALVLGILGIIPFLGLLLGLVAIILGVVSLAQNRPKKGSAIAGIALGAVLPMSAVMITSLIISVAMPSLGTARERARQVKCGMNLNMLATSVGMYGSDYDGASPPDLDALVDGGYMSSTDLDCPSAGSSGQVDYFYLPPAEDAPPSTVIACDRKGNHADGRNIVDLGGNLRWLTEQEFQQLLGKPENAAFARALKQAEGP